MKNQFRKGFRQEYKGVQYNVRTIKLGSNEKILLRDEILVSFTTRKKPVSNSG